MFIVLGRVSVETKTGPAGIASDGGVGSLSHKAFACKSNNLRGKNAADSTTQSTYSNTPTQIVATCP